MYSHHYVRSRLIVFHTTCVCRCDMAQGDIVLKTEPLYLNHFGIRSVCVCEYVGMTTPHAIESLHSHIDVQCLCASLLSLSVRLKDAAKVRIIFTRMVAEPSADGLHLLCVLPSTLLGRSNVGVWSRRFCSRPGHYRRCEDVFGTRPHAGHERRRGF